MVSVGFDRSLLHALAFFQFFTAVLSQVPVSVYYESHCPDSRQFIRNVMAPAYDRIGSKISLSLVPFGKARRLKNGELQCQHGPKECKGNMLQACALSMLATGRPQVDYVTCAMYSPGYTDQSCVENAGLDWNAVLSCMSGGLGRELIMQNEMDTITNTPAPYGKNHGPRFVPTIVLNNAYNDDDQDTAFIDLEAAVCKYTAC